MAYLDLSKNQMKKLVKTELEESQDYDFPDFMLSETTKVIKDWGATLDYNKLKKLKKSVDNLLNELDEEL